VKNIGYSGLMYQKQSWVKVLWRVLPHGYLLNWPGMLAMTGMLVLAAWNGQAPIVVLTSLLFSSAGLAKLWSHLSLARISSFTSIGTRPFKAVSILICFVSFSLSSSPADDEGGQQL